MELSKDKIDALKVIAKSSAKACIVLLSGWITYKLGDNPQVATAVAIAMAPILKIVDPKDLSIGINKGE